MTMKSDLSVAASAPRQRGSGRSYQKPQPLYQRIKSYVADRIANGTWKAGDRVPSEHELAATLGASRLTVHRAFRELTAAGILSRLHGVGTFVSKPGAASTIVRLHNIADEIRRRGDRLSVKVHRLAKIKATRHLAACFEIEPRDELFHSLIVYSANDLPVQLEDRHVSPEFAPEFLKQDFRAQSTTDYLQSIALATEALLMIEAVRPDANTCKLLDMPGDEPCLTVTRQTRVGELVTTHTRFFHPGSRHRITSHFDFRAEHGAELNRQR